MSLLNEHLDSVGETYLQHFLHACRFSLTMAIGSVACLMHAVFPFLFVKTGSGIITKLHDDMVANRQNLTPSNSGNIDAEITNAR